jgi:HAD superfamily hydrolase (TIGR01509 family)
MRIRGVIFDLDGTLVDTNAAHVEAWHRAFADRGYDIPADRIGPHIGKGGDQLVPALLPKEQAEKDGDALRELNGEHFVALAGKVQFNVFPRAVDLLRAVRDRGLTTALATSSKPHHLEATFKSCGIDFRKLVDQPTDAGDADRSKPHPDLISAAADKLGLPPAACVVVGDTPYDGQAARHAGARFWGVLCGGPWFTADDLRAAGADAVFRDPADLLARLDDALDAGNENPPADGGPHHLAPQGASHGG